MAFPSSGEITVISFQTYIGSAYSSHPVRWIETPESARSRSGIDQISEKPVEKITDPDLGKPRSDSGDVLDISLETQKTLDLSRSDTQFSQENGKTSGEKTVENDQGAVRIVGESTETLPTNASPTGGELTPEQQQQVADLKARDQEIRIHEMAHVLAGGPYVTSGPSYQYEMGPDGKGYAVAGSVGIDTSPVQGDPEATIAKMQAVAAAALAPSQPSGQDYKVAAAARQAEAQARAELTQQRVEQPEGEKQPEHEDVAAFSIVRTADKTAETPVKSEAVEEGAMPSLVRTQPKPGLESAPSSAYKAQSSMTLASAPQFSVFA